MTRRTSFIHHEPEIEINGLSGLIIGTAVYDCTIEDTFDGDIGGVDGAIVTGCEFLGIDIDGEMIGRNLIEAIIGRPAVEAMEDRIAERVLLQDMERDAA